MTAAQFWAYVAHADALVPPATAVVTVAAFVSKAVRKYIIRKAGEVAGAAAAGFMTTFRS